MTYNFKIKNIECDNCCNKIVDKINKNKDIEVNINVMFEKITINSNLEIDVIIKIVDDVLKKFKPMSIIWQN